MSTKSSGTVHSAEAAALGFYYQAYYALLVLLDQATDDAAIGIEQLDDIELKADKQTLLYQLKHSMSASPPAISLKSKSFWRTVKIWVDILPTLSLSETSLHLVTVAPIPVGSPLQALTSPDLDRAALVDAMCEEAERVRAKRADAAAKKKNLPYADRADGCEAFLSVGSVDRLNLMRRVIICADSPDISAIEPRVASHSALGILPANQRPIVAQRLLEWWDRQIIYALCGKRQAMVSRTELQSSVSTIISDIEQEKLTATFEHVSQPADYQPDGMLARQIYLVAGKPSDLAKAIREEWRARNQRSMWMSQSPAMQGKIHEYDQVLIENWSDRHNQMREDCEGAVDEAKCAAGLTLLRWTHEHAPGIIYPIVSSWNAPYYVRGSYQVLAINLQVGWHPDFEKRLSEKK